LVDLRDIQTFFAYILHIVSLSLFLVQLFLVQSDFENLDMFWVDRLEVKVEYMGQQKELLLE